MKGRGRKPWSHANPVPDVCYRGYYEDDRREPARRTHGPSFRQNVYNDDTIVNSNIYRIKIKEWGHCYQYPVSL